MSGAFVRRTSLRRDAYFFAKEPSRLCVALAAKSWENKQASHDNSGEHLGGHEPFMLRVCANVGIGTEKQDEHNVM